MRIFATKSMGKRLAYNSESILSTFLKQDKKIFLNLGIKLQANSFV